MIRRAWNAWVDLLDRKEPPTALAMVRIGLSFVLLVDYLNVWRAGLVGPIWSAPPNGFAIGHAAFDLPAMTLWAIAVGSLAAICIGAATRVACLGFVFAAAQLSALTPNSESALDMLARVVFVLALSQCNARWSIDAMLARRLGRTVPGRDSRVAAISADVPARVDVLLGRPEQVERRVGPDGRLHGARDRADRGARRALRSRMGRRHLSADARRDRVDDGVQLVVLRDPVATRRRAGLDLARVGRDREIGDERILGFARSGAR